MVLDFLYLENDLQIWYISILKIYDGKKRVHPHNQSLEKFWFYHWSESDYEIKNDKFLIVN